MRKWITLLMTLLVGCGASYANANNGQVIFDAGYRHDTINWKSQFPSNDPFVSNNQKFKDLDIFQIGLHGRTTVGNNFYVRGDAYWGWILDGKYHHQADLYAGNNNSYYDGTTLELSGNNYSTIDDKYVFGVGAAIGYPFYMCDCTMLIAPVVGYSFDEQNIRVDDAGFDNFYSYNDTNGGCCRRSFISRWYGPFIGFDFDYRPFNSCVNVWAEFEYHWANFSGRRSNFSNNDIDGFRRTSHNGSAYVFGAGIDYEVSCDWTIGLSVKFQDWEASRHKRLRGDLESYMYNSGRSNDRIKHKNTWRSYAINLTLGREF